MKDSVLMRSINTLYFRQNNSLILKLTSGQRKMKLKNSGQTYGQMKFNLITRQNGFLI
jgi:hypothetical protein